MKNSNFWYYVIMVIVILHVVVGFGYLAYKLSPKKNEKSQKEKSKEDNDL